MKQTDKKARKEYCQTVFDLPTKVMIPGTNKTVKLRGIKPYTIERLTLLWLKREDLSAGIDSASTMKSLCIEPYFSVKEALLFVLNDYWKINLFLRPMTWWWGKVKGYTEEQMSPIILEGKKKTSAYGTLDQYGVLSGYEDGLDEDDEEGSRAIPSRTTFGCESAFIKEFPCYGGSRRYFFGLVTVRNWAYRCELTLPQIELMMSDLPHTLYRRHQNETNNPKGLKKSEYDEAVRRNMESIRKSRERRKKERAEQAPTIEELFNGVADEE